MSDLVIMRIAKIKTMGALVAASRHHTRDRPTPNADPAGAVFIAVGSGCPERDARRRLADLPKPPRKNAVLGFEVLLSASPSWWRPDDPTAAGVYDDDRLSAWTQAAVDWLQAEFGSANVVSLHVHADEATPHAHALVIPVDEIPSGKGRKVGPRLNAARWLDGADRMASLQDSAAAAFASLGLERGRRKSKATHQAVRAWYGAQDKATALARQAAEAARQVIDRARYLAHVLTDREREEVARLRASAPPQQRQRRRPNLGAR